MVSGTHYKTSLNFQFMCIPCIRWFLNIIRIYHSRSANIIIFKRRYLLKYAFLKTRRTKVTVRSRPVNANPDHCINSSKLHRKECQIPNMNWGIVRISLFSIDSSVSAITIKTEMRLRYIL